MATVNLAQSFSPSIKECRQKVVSWGLLGFFLCAAMASLLAGRQVVRSNSDHGALWGQGGHWSPAHPSHSAMLSMVSLVSFMSHGVNDVLFFLGVDGSCRILVICLFS